MRISDWSSDVCSSDLRLQHALAVTAPVVEELDDGHVAVGVAEHRVAGPALTGVAVLAEGGLRRRLLRRLLPGVPRLQRLQLGRASCRARVCPYGSISVVAVSLTNQHTYSSSIL